MTKIELMQAGRLLYGERWQAALARALGVSDRTVRRWASGAQPIPSPAAIAVQALADNVARQNRPRRVGAAAC
jgi:DNA-binding transcriptional regulator YdaS (Cro superfamily)